MQAPLHEQHARTLSASQLVVDRYSCEHVTESVTVRTLSAPSCVQSKLAVQMITAELAQRLAGRKPTVNCLDPGAVLPSALRPRLAGASSTGLYSDRRGVCVQALSTPKCSSRAGAAAAWRSRCKYILLLPGPPVLLVLQ